MRKISEPFFPLPITRRKHSSVRCTRVQGRAGQGADGEAGPRADAHEVVRRLLEGEHVAADTVVPVALFHLV